MAYFSSKGKGRTQKKPGVRPIHIPLEQVANLRLARGSPSSGWPIYASLEGPSQARWPISASLEGSGSTLEQVTNLRLA